LKTTKLFLASAGMAIAASGALSHPLLKSADPKPNAAIAASPTHIRIGFSEGLVEVFSGIEVDNEKGHALSTGSAAVDPTDSTQLIVPLTVKLPPGKYTVKWHVVGDDTHRVAGHYSFQVK
jgi:methionine-rich copper-binding protein CopC